MTTKLLSTGIWGSITAATRKVPGGCYVAVAYFGNGAIRQLPLSRGSTLIVDMSEQAVKSGQTKPSELLMLVNRGVVVHSVRNLHAKVFVIGKHAFIGSTNVSRHSANDLLEAVVQTDDQAVVSSCRLFVKSLQGELVTPEHARQMEKLYRPPKFGGGRRNQVSKTKAVPGHSPLWVVPLDLDDWDKGDDEQQQQGLPTAQSRLRSSELFLIDEFRCLSKHLLDGLKTNDLIVQILRENKKRQMVSPASRVVHIQRYKDGRTHRAIVFLEKAKRSRCRNLDRIIKRIGPRAKELGKVGLPKRLRDRGFVHALLNTWSSTNGQ
jgi:hypothetical protein